jgi:hypothetical protein
MKEEVKIVLEIKFLIVLQRPSKGVSLRKPVKILRFSFIEATNW